MMMGEVIGLAAGGGVSVRLLGRSGAGIEVPIAAGNIAAAVTAVGSDPQGGTVTAVQRALRVGDRVAVAELTAEPGSWLLVARLTA